MDLRLDAARADGLKPNAPSANFQGSEFECFGFVGDCGIIVKLRVKVADKKLDMD